MSAAARWLTFACLLLPRSIARGAALGWRFAEPVLVKTLSPVEIVYEALLRVYPRILRGALARPGAVLGGATLALAAALLAAAALPKNLLPPVAQGEFAFDVRLPEGTALAVTDRVLARVAETVREDERVTFVYTSSGQTNLAEFAGSAREANRGQIAVVMKTTDRRAEDAVVGALRQALGDVPGLTYDFGRPALLSFRAPVEVEVYSRDLDTLGVAAGRVAQAIAGVRGVADVESSVRTGDPEVQVAFDRARLASMDLDPAGASELLRNAVQGDPATQFSDLDRKLDVRVRATPGERAAVTDLHTLEVGRSEDGRVVPLAAVADVRLTRGPGEIRRIGQQRAAVVTANLDGRDLGSAARDIESALAPLRTPGGARIALAGQNEELAQSYASLRLAILLAIFLVYLVMASQFESLLHPFVIMFTLPLGVIGVVLTLVITRTPISVMVLIGMLVLAGIVVKNAIILVDYTNRLREAGRAKVDALVEAGSVRLRPILMTTLTTVLGLVPLSLGIGRGSEIGQPLAITIIGGLTFATALTLVVIPVVYATLDRRA
jgi:HAE1 family hydrophobic/amphiphilic exporter-1